MAQVVEINDPAELAGYRLLWTKLYSETAGASFFHSLDWLETYWQYHGDRQRLRVLVVYAAGSPIGILPLVVRRETTRLGTVRVLTYPLADWGSFYGPIGPNPTATLIAGLGHVRRTEADWDLIDLRWIDGPEACDRTLRAMEIRGFSATTACGPRAAGRARQELGRLLGRPQTDLAEERSLCRKATGDAWPGRVLAVPAAGTAWGDGDPNWPLYDTCESLATRSWQGSSTTGTTLSHEAVQPFLRAATRRRRMPEQPTSACFRSVACRWRLPTAIRPPVMFTVCGWDSTASKPTKEPARCCWRD